MEKKTLRNYQDSDSDSESHGTLSDSSSSESSGPNHIQFAKKLRFNEGYQDTDATYNFPSTFTEKQELPKTEDITTLFLIDSINRDKNAFPQPTSFSLRLPRVYKNVKSVQLTEVKLLCSFYYFSATKNNIFLPIIERGRESINQYNGVPISKMISIREGTYNINDLLSEIQTELNYTPLFYDYPNGFVDFINIFSVSGDFSVNFNQPGDTYYDSLNSKYITNPTMATIISYYWGSRYANLTNYSIDQLKVAYYYPVLYEVLLDLNDTTVKPFLNLSAPPNYVSQDNLPASSHVIYNMSGINDPIALYLINNNLTLLNTYRVNHTFRYSLINRYQVSYDTNSLHVNFTTIGLNTSLINLLNMTSSAALSSSLNNSGLTSTSYSNLQSAIGVTTVIYNDMFNFLQTQLASLLGISYGKYTASFFSNYSNSIYFQDGTYAEGINKKYNLSFLESAQSAISSSQVRFSDSPGYWPNLVSSRGYTGVGIANINSQYNLIPYNTNTKNFLFGNAAIDRDTGLLNINPTSQSLDIVINILPAQYTVLKFKSLVRQTLQVETLPLPYYYRYSDYNKQGLYTGILDLQKNNVPMAYFDISYSYVYDNTNNGMDIINYSPTILQPTFGASFNQSFSLASTITITSLNNYQYFEFISPSIPGISIEIPTVNTTRIAFVSINPSNISTLFLDSFSVFIYHDRGAFMADLGNQRNENPLHYIASLSTNTGSSDLTVQLSTFSGHTYYSIFRSNNLSCSKNIVRPVIYYNNSSYTPFSTDLATLNPNANPYNTSNLSTFAYAINYNTNFLRLPVTSTLMNIDPSDSIFNNNLSINDLPIGYDSNGVSNDLTDYIGFNTISQSVNPISKIRIDPLNNFIFNSNTPYNTELQSYINSNSRNFLLYSTINNPYSFTGTSTSQVKIVQWYEGYSIPFQLDDKIITFNNLGILQTSSLSAVLSTFPANNSNIVFGRGISAIGFLPNDGVYNLSDFSFKSCLYPLTGNEASLSDPNLNIKYIGVFTGESLINPSLLLSSAITVLKFNKTVTYGPQTIATGFTYGTWYQYIKDTSFISNNNNVINGYTPDGTTLLNYTSLYYMVPFSEQGKLLTYSILSGSILPYPLQQTYNFSTVYLNDQVALEVPGSTPQPGYIIPEYNASTIQFGPKDPYTQYQSQYELSIPITTPSIGFKVNSLLVNEKNAPYNFNTSFSNLQSIGLTTFFSEFSDNLYLVNSTSNICSNANTSIPTANYASSLSTAISVNSGNPSCIHFMTNPGPALQNYTVNGQKTVNRVFPFSEMPGDDSNITIQSFELNTSMNNLTLTMWGGGGGSLSSLSSSTGGAGAYVKVRINPQALLDIKTPDSPEGISTLHIVVGKGGNLDNFKIENMVGSLQLYEQMRYGGGGTSLSGIFTDSNSITAQGGGFSGIFSGSNIYTATPLLIVGGGGAAGSSVNNLGGPGGFGITTLLLSTSTYTFSSVSFDGKFYNRLPVQSIVDVFNNGSDVNNAIDNSFLTHWDPVIPAKLNPFNYFSTPNTYGVSLNFTTSNAISKLRFYGPSESNVTNLPTGFILYNDINKQQILYSNTSINYTDYLVINNGTFLQQVYDIIPTTLVLNTPIQSNAWLVGGINSSSKILQYSLDSINWIPINNIPLSIIQSIHYSSNFNKWYASGPGIIYSLDGINWLQFVINNAINLNFNTIAEGNSSIVAGTNDGSIFITIDGIRWNLVGKIFNTSITRIRFINNKFWAVGGNYLKNSVDGINWVSIINFTNSSMNDIAYGMGYYVITQNNGNQGDPLISGIIYSSDGIRWNATNVMNFTGLSVVYGNNIFVACGSSTDNTSFIKYSVDAIVWNNSNFLVRGDLYRNNIEFSGSKFISVGEAAPGTGLAGNQVSIVTSLNGRDWDYSLTGGFDPDAGSYGGKISAYGPVTIIPNNSTLYLEIQKSTFSNFEPNIYELRAYDSLISIVADTTPLLDSNLTTIFYPSELNTVDVINYPFIFSFQTPVPQLNAIEIYTPIISGAQLTGIRIALDNTAQTVIYNTMELVQTSVVLINTINYNYYKISLLNVLINISTLYITCFKDTPGSIQIAGINGSYDPNILATQKIPISIRDSDNRPPFNQNTILANIIDGNVLTFWKPASFMQAEPLRITVNFSEAIDRINCIRLFNGSYPPNLSDVITRIGIYTNSTKSSEIFSNTTTLNFSQYLSYYIIDLDIIPLINYTSIYIEIYKDTPGIPIINEIQFFNRTLITDSTSGYSAGKVTTMSRDSTPISIYDGGGGTITTGGNAGLYGSRGEYMIGGTPAILSANQLINSTSSMIISAGGGGGGYYGGGGGGLLTNGTGAAGGGAGGGGAGYIYQESTVFTILEYGIALPQLNDVIKNYISPGSLEQDNLVINKVILEPTIYYGQGGNPSINSGKGAHGLVVFSYYTLTNIPPIPSPNVYPSFIDGSKLSVFQAPIIYNLQARNLSFIPYVDSIQLTPYSRRNWIWYRSYLLLVGNSLTYTFTPSRSTPIQPSDFPSLPLPIYSQLSQLFSTINSAFINTTSDILQSTVTSITNSINTIFTSFQNIYFLHTLFTDTSYIEFTEIYCLLDYLRNPVNLANPHVNPLNPTLDRILGGIPRFGYWANPFLTNVSYIGFDVAKSQIPTPSLSTIASNGNPVQAIFGLILEQSISSGIYQFKDIMAYKPTLNDSIDNGSQWLTVTQFPEAYAVRSMTNIINTDSNVIVQPYTFRNAISARLPLFNYSVYSIPATIKSVLYDIPVQIINDFEGQSIQMYSFQNNIISDISSINLASVPFTSTMIYMNQSKINKSTYNSGIIGTLVSEYQSTIVNAITSFSFDTITFTPVLQFSTGSNNFYNTYSYLSLISNTNIGKALIDYDGNYYVTLNDGGNLLYQNKGVSEINPTQFLNTNISYASPKYILNEINNGNINVVSDFFVSKFTNIWHFTTSNSRLLLYGARLTSQYDLSIITSFANQVFYPTHKITMIKNGSIQTPITNTGDTLTYPSYQHTNMFFYKNFSSLVNDISGQFAMEKAANFSHSDAFSGYNFNSFISNINLQPADTADNEDSYNYLAIRGYSPTEKFQSILRFYLPQRYDFGFISLLDLSNEQQVIANFSNVNPKYKSLLSLFNSSFSTNRVYGSVGMPGFSGSNISTTGFGDFLRQFNTINTINTSNNALISSINGQSNAILFSLITNDLSTILPSYLATRNRITDPIEFSIPFSSCVAPSNRGSEQYGLGYNLGFVLKDTDHNTVQRGTSFFKILDDYIYLQMNEEFNMNRMDISKPENFSKTRDTTAQSGLYNSKLILNTFGSFATTFVKSPVTFNPVVGKIDKLTFTWYNSAGVLLDNADCEWSGSVQIVEAVNTK